MITNTQKFILDFSQYDIEPLYILIPAIKDDFNITDKEITAELVKLCELGYLNCFLHSGVSNDKYEDITKRITVDMLQERIKKESIPVNTTEYYPLIPEYFFQTTDNGINLLNKSENQKDGT